VDHSKTSGFQCSKCPERIQKLRRCREDKEFTSADGSLWPMRIQEGGGLYGFCPGKATWDHEAVSVYRTLVLTAETGALLHEGGIAQQPGWYIEMCGWFIPQYKNSNFYAKAKSILGDGKGAKGSGNNSRRFGSKGRRR